MATEEPEIEPNSAEVMTAILAGPAAPLAGERGAEIHEELAGAASLQEGAEDHEGKHEGGEGGGDHAEQGLLRRKGEFDDARDAEAGMGELARQVFTEIELGEKNDGDDHHGDAEHAAAGLQHHRDADDAHIEIPLIGIAHAVDGVIGVLIDPVADRDDRGRHPDKVEQARPGFRRRRQRREQQEHQHRGQHQIEAAVALGRNQTEARGVEVPEAEEDGGRRIAKRDRPAQVRLRPLIGLIQSPAIGMTPHGAAKRRCPHCTIQENGPPACAGGPDLRGARPIPCKVPRTCNRRWRPDAWARRAAGSYACRAPSAPRPCGRRPAAS